MKRVRYEPSSRETAAEDLLLSLHAEAATFSGVQMGQSAGGLGVFSTRDIPSGGEVFRCPCSVLLTAQAALSDATIGDHLQDSAVAHQLDDRWRVILLLMHRRREGSPYALSLPGLELVHSLPLHWTEREQQELLGGTALLQQARASQLFLRTFFETVLHVLCIKWPKAFPTDDQPSEQIAERRLDAPGTQGSFGWEALCWAHAMFWSRAISLDLPGGRCVKYIR